MVFAMNAKEMVEGVVLEEIEKEILRHNQSRHLTHVVFDPALRAVYIAMTLQSCQYLPHEM